MAAEEGEGHSGMSSEGRGPGGSRSVPGLRSSGPLEMTLLSSHLPPGAECATPCLPEPFAASLPPSTLLAHRQSQLVDRVNFSLGSNSV